MPFLIDLVPRVRVSMKTVSAENYLLANVALAATNPLTPAFSISYVLRARSRSDLKVNAFGLEKFY